MKYLKKLKRIVILDDYKKSSAHLAVECEQLADIIMKKMIDLDMWLLFELY